MMKNINAKRPVFLARFLSRAWVAFNGWLDRLEGREVSRKIEQQRSSLLKQGFKDYEIAASWGYDLCDCTNPPQIMLFVWRKEANICPLCERAEPCEMNRVIGNQARMS